MVVVNDQVPGTSSGISPSRPKGILGVDLPCEGPLAEPPGSGPDPALVYPPDTTCDVEVRDEEATPCVGVGTRASEVGGAECDKRVSWGAMHVGGATLEGPAPLCTNGESASPSNEEIDRLRDARETEGVGTERWGELCASEWHTGVLATVFVAPSWSPETSDTDRSSAGIAM